jgi:pimeloyl-ACP methyl ester carboxylesterase
VDVRLADGVSLFVEELGDGFPVFVLHGGPGFDHSMFRPWLDPLADEFRVLYVDERGQGRSDRVDPATLTLEVFARDVDLLAEALQLDGFALLGHSFGAIVTTAHAIELGTAAAYVISGGGDSSAGLEQDVATSLEALGDAGTAVAASWELEKTVSSDEQMLALWQAQMPMHFAGEPPPGFGESTVFSPGVLRHFANSGYGAFDFVPYLHHVSRSTLVIVGEHDQVTTPRAAEVLHQGIADSELHVVAEAGHMSFVEARDAYLDVVRAFLRRALA